MDRERLIKLMRMTESANDGEALNALRMANRLLTEAKMNWSDVLKVTTLDQNYADAMDNLRRAAGFASKYGAPAKPMNPRAASSRTAGRPFSSFRKENSAEQVRTPDIDRMLTALRNRKHEMSFMMFLASVTKFYSDNQYLTRAQYNAVKLAYEYP